PGADRVHRRVRRAAGHVRGALPAGARAQLRHRAEDLVAVQAGAREGHPGGRGRAVRGRRAVRLWSLHPAHLDRAGLVACWREALLAQAVLAERTRGYRHHPQLTRFRALPDPLAGIGGYLSGLADEADRRGYRFDRGRLIAAPDDRRIIVTDGQL